MAVDSWTFWKGEWGATGGPQSPGQQGMFKKSWEGCADDDEGCPLPLLAPARRHRARAASGRRPPRMIKGPDVKACESWFGADVVALLCESDRLAAGVEEAGLGIEKGMSVRVERAPGATAHARDAAAKTERSGSVLGLSQVVGAPLRPGDEIKLSARPLSPRWQMLLRVRIANRTVEARFLRVGFDQAEVTRVRGLPALLLPSGQIRLPSAARVSG